MYGFFNIILSAFFGSISIFLYFENTALKCNKIYTEETILPKNILAKNYCQKSWARDLYVKFSSMVLSGNF